ncbi:integrase [Azonexus hydrophilus]|uniref:integrase n=1 Tax=Azonexus hydrophilus TaxID=418702 RepID=UPI001965BDCF|nr:tyrosine-type recombinase/integrase [Azonexus hydrophilus]
MATITKRGEYSWRVQVRRKGQPPMFKTFNYKSDAEKWARQMEAELDRGLYLPRREAEKTTFEELAERFKAEFAPHHYRGNGWKYKLQHLIAAFGKYSLAAITSALVASYRDERLQQPDPRFRSDPKAAPRVSPATVKTEIDLLSKVLDVGSKEFGITLPNGNPVKGVRKPQGGQGRERRLHGDEEQRLLAECDTSGNPWLGAAVRLAIETAMRQGELLALNWKHVDFKRRIALLPMTKNGEARTIPLSPAALAVLQGLPTALTGEVLPLSRMTLYKAFERACQRAEISELTFHDLRHEALSRLAERGDFSVLELAAVSGHKSLQVLKRYTHLQAEKLAAKLAIG